MDPSEVAKRLSREDRKRFDTLISRGKLAQECEDYEAAFKYYSEAKELFPEHPLLDKKLAFLAKKGGITAKQQGSAGDENFGPVAVAAGGRLKKEASTAAYTPMPAKEVREAGRRAALEEEETAEGAGAVAAAAAAAAAGGRNVRKALVIDSPEAVVVSTAPATAASVLASSKRQAAIVIADSPEAASKPAPKAAVAAQPAASVLPAKKAAPAAVEPSRKGKGKSMVIEDEEEEEEDAPSAAVPAPAAAGAPAALASAAPLSTLVDGYTLSSPSPSSPSPDDSSSSYASLPGGFSLPLPLFQKLYGYQRAGVAWMWSLHPDCPASPGSLGRAAEEQLVAPDSLYPALKLGSGGGMGGAGSSGSSRISGGILADDMGLGKTLQTVSFITGLLHSEKMNAALILAPLSLLSVWEAEFQKWAPEVRVRVVHEQPVKQRQKAIDAVMRKGGVVITTYGTCTANPGLLGVKTAAMAALERELKEAEEEAKRARAAAGKGGKKSSKATAAAAAAAAAGEQEQEGADEEEGSAAGSRKGKGGQKAVPATPGEGETPLHWDVIVLDEGHKIKNTSTQVAKVVRCIPSTLRLLLSGTPIQNNLDELWALFDFSCKGQLLGSRRAFNAELADPIVQGRDKHASEEAKERARKAAECLSALIRPHLLRREKDKVLAQEKEKAGAAGGAAVAGEGGSAASTASTGAGAGPAQISSKTELVIWTKMQQEEIALYARFLESSAVRSLVSKSGSPLAALTVLRKIATHPLLLGAAGLKALVMDLEAASEKSRASTAAAAVGLDAPAPAQTVLDSAALHGRELQGMASLLMASAGLFGVPAAELRSAAAGGVHTSSSSSSSLADIAAAAADDDEEAEGGKSKAASVWIPHALPSGEELAACSGKVQFFLQLVRELLLGSHRLLVFSQSKRMLDILQRCLQDCCAGLACCVRIDGTVSSAEERRSIVKRFNEGKGGCNVCLLTTGVGAHGLTLTGADRVILFDPSWNPSTEAQAVDRAYRVGQTKDVVTYRLIAVGTVEEKVYRQQMFKGGLTSTVMGAATATASSKSAASKEVTRYLSKQDMKDIFTLGNTETCATKALIDSAMLDGTGGQRGITLGLPEALTLHVERLQGLHHQGAAGLTTAAAAGEAAGGAAEGSLSSLHAGVTRHDMVLHITARLQKQLQEMEQKEKEKAGKGRGRMASSPSSSTLHAGTSVASTAEGEGEDGGAGDELEFSVDGLEQAMADKCSLGLPSGSTATAAAAAGAGASGAATSTAASGVLFTPASKELLRVATVLATEKKKEEEQAQRLQTAGVTQGAGGVAGAGAAVPAPAGRRLVNGAGPASLATRRQLDMDQTMLSVDSPVHTAPAAVAGTAAAVAGVVGTGAQGRKRPQLVVLDDEEEDEGSIAAAPTSAAAPQSVAASTQVTNTSSRTAATVAETSSSPAAPSAAAKSVVLDSTADLFPQEAEQIAVAAAAANAEDSADADAPAAGDISLLHDLTALHELDISSIASLPLEEGQLGLGRQSLLLGGRQSLSTAAAGGMRGGKGRQSLSSSSVFTRGGSGGTDASFVDLASSSSAPFTAAGLSTATIATVAAATTSFTGSTGEGDLTAAAAAAITAAAGRGSLSRVAEEGDSAMTSQMQHSRTMTEEGGQQEGEQGEGRSQENSRNVSVSQAQQFSLLNSSAASAAVVATVEKKQKKEEAEEAEEEDCDDAASDVSCTLQSLVCEAHKQQCVQAGLKADTLSCCVCHASEEDKELLEYALQEAEELLKQCKAGAGAGEDAEAKEEKESAMREQMQDALATLLDAMDLVDAEVRLHRQAMLLGKQLAFF